MNKPLDAKKPPLTANERLLIPRRIVGTHPATKVIYTLTITDKKMVIIERFPYVSPCSDGWTEEYKTLTEPAENHIWLILTIQNNQVEQ